MATSGNNPLTTSSSGDTFRCPICLEEVRNPKHLLCLHTFCATCIQTYISSTATCHVSLNSKTIDCPVCRRRIDAPRKDITDEEWASSLPQNKLVVSMGLSTNNDDEQICKFCERNEKSVPAKNWCKACMETICDECKTFHKLVPSLQNHKIVNLGDTRVCKDDVEELCPEHQGKIIDAFCHQHQKLCCCICLVNHHRLCPKVEALENIEEKTEHDVQNIIESFSNLEKCIENMQEQNKTKIVDLIFMKQDIGAKTEKAIQEITTLINDAHARWIKVFEQIHADSVGNLEIASDELKRFSTTVSESRILLHSMLKSGTPKQLFITKQYQLARIVDHFIRLKSLDIWKFTEKYTQPDTDFLKQLLNQKKFEDVKLSKTPSGTIQAILHTAPKFTGSEFLQRKLEMSTKDWMKITCKLLSGIHLSESVYYGVFVHDTHIMLPFKNPPSLKIIDFSEPNGKCVHTEECPSIPYDLCHSRVNESMNEVYVSYKNSVVLYCIDVEGTAKFTELQTIHLNESMPSIACGLTTVFCANDNKAFICSWDFKIEHSLTFSLRGSMVPFVSSSSKSDYHCYSAGGHIVVADRNNTLIFKSNGYNEKLRGMTFDLDDNIMVCNRTNKLKQIRYGGQESRNIELDGIRDSYNVVLHPTGEKMMVLDYDKKCCVYQIT